MSSSAIGSYTSLNTQSNQHVRRRMGFYFARCDFRKIGYLWKWIQVIRSRSRDARPAARGHSWPRARASQTRGQRARAAFGKTARALPPAFASLILLNSLVYRTSWEFRCNSHVKGLGRFNLEPMSSCPPRLELGPYLRWISSCSFLSPNRRWRSYCCLISGRMPLQNTQFNTHT